jgi:hypothetical protein
MKDPLSNDEPPDYDLRRRLIAASDGALTEDFTGLKSARAWLRKLSLDALCALIASESARFGGARSSIHTLGFYRKAVEASTDNLGGKPVTANDYISRALAYCRRNYGPADEGRWPILARADHPEEWLLWTRYFQKIGMKASARELRDPDTKHWGVPSIHPAEFDPAGAPL